MKDNVLKNYDKELSMMILVNIGLFIYWTNMSQLEDFILRNKIILSFLISLISPLLITNIIPRGWKDLFIGYLESRDSSRIYKFFTEHLSINPEKFKKHAFLPGFCIFSKLDNNEIDNEKIKKDILKEKYRIFPKKAEEQNDLWYKIYRSHENSPRIYPNYRYWLMLRDMVTLNIFLTMIISVFSLFNTLSFSLNWTIFMILQIIFEIFICRRYCNKYVEQVLVEETYNLEKEEIKEAKIINNTTINYFPQREVNEKY